MEGTLLASNLGFPEGPVVMPDGSIVICDGNIGELLRWDGDSMATFVATGGSPWGAVLGSDGAVYVTQGGNVPGSPDQSAVAGIQRVNGDGSVEMLSTELGGHTLAGPNDLAFGPDGRLWFTDSGTEQDDRFAPEERAPGRLFVLGSGGAGEFLLERRDVYPNGIAFDAQGRLYWTESAAHRVCRLDDGQATTFCQLSDGHVPDGMAFAADGRLFVCTTISGRRHGALGRRRGARGDLARRARHELHLRRLDALRHRDEGRRDPRRPAHRHVLARRDRRVGAAAAPAGQAVTAEPPGPGPVRRQAYGVGRPPTTLH